MVPQPGGPSPRTPDETCGKVESRSTIVIRESGQPEKQIVVQADGTLKASGALALFDGPLPTNPI
jgi:hypothetical protein